MEVTIPATLVGIFKRYYSGFKKQLEQASGSITVEMVNSAYQLL
jgi:hypothetical protein